MAIAGLLLLPAVFASCPCQQLLPAASAGCPCQQLRHGAQASTSFPMELRCNSLASNSSAIAPRPAASSRWCFATAPLPAAFSRWLFAAAPLPVTAMPRRSLQQHLCYGAPASNKPHPAEKSTPVWLAIWRIWAGFANSQLLPDAAALSSMQGLPRSGNSSAQTSASLHPPAALRLRCLPFTRDMGVHGLCGRVPDSAGNVSPWIESAQT